MITLVVALAFAALAGWFGYRIGLATAARRHAATLDKYERITDQPTRATGVPTNIEGGDARVTHGHWRQRRRWRLQEPES